MLQYTYIEILLFKKRVRCSLKEDFLCDRSRKKYLFVFVEINFYTKTVFQNEPFLVYILLFDIY